MTDLAPSEAPSAVGDPPTESPLEEPGKPELVLGFVRTLGTDLTQIDRVFDDVLGSARFQRRSIRLSALLKDLDRSGYLKDAPRHRRYATHMDLGDNYRAFTRDKSAVALLGVKALVNQRAEWMKEEAKPGPSAARSNGWSYRIASLMLPAEVSTLRQIYSKQFFLISVSAPLDTRLQLIATQIAESAGMPVENCKAIASDLLNRDAGSLSEYRGISLHPDVAPDDRFPSKDSFRVDVGKTFELADVFVSSTDLESSERTIRRFLELIMSHPFHTPTRDEMGMYAAYGYALRSASLARRVGAAILSEQGDVISVGANDVPRYGGGLYWAEESPDHRDFRLGYDSNDRTKRALLLDFILRMRASTWFEDALGDQATAVLERLNAVDSESLLTATLKDAELSAASFLDVIEFGRPVHAEMAAISEAARLGIPVKGATLYCTTFPCHECARHLVACGIERVVYIEAYEKSRVQQLYSDSIGLAERVQEIGRKVRFEPFVGIGPRRFVDLFSWVPRRECDREASDYNDLKGNIVEWELATAPVRDSIINPNEAYAITQRFAVRAAEQFTVEECDREVQNYLDSRSPAE